MSHIPKDIILTASTNSTITAYQPHTTAPLSSFAGSLAPRHGIAFTKTPLFAATHVSPNSAPSSGCINLYNWWAPTPFHSIPVPEPVAPIASTPDGSFVFAGGASGRIYAFALPSQLLHRSFQAHQGPVSCMAISDGSSTLLVSGSEDGTIAVFSILQALDAYVNADVSPLYRISAHDSVVTCIAPGAAYMISSSGDGTCKVWNVTDGARIRSFRFGTPMWCVAVDFARSTAYGGGLDGCVYAMSMRRRLRGKEVDVTVWDKELQCGAVVGVAVTNDGRNLVSAWEDGVVKVRDVDSGSVVSVVGRKRSCGSITGLLVARVVGDGVIENEVAGRGFCERAMRRRSGGSRNVEEMKGWLDVARKDRSRAMDMLEEAMESYERLLGLLLKEAKGGEDVEETKLA